MFEIELLEQIKGIGRGRGKEGNLGYRDRLRVPIIENTAKCVEMDAVASFFDPFSCLSIVFFLSPFSALPWGLVPRKRR